MPLRITRTAFDERYEKDPVRFLPRETIFIEEFGEEDGVSP
jgi:hypothetical protein